MSINWGIIGCGDVTEIKSGPAFNKVAGSKLVAVMRRNAAKAKDYAERHGVPAWYTDADALIDNPGVNAIYVATPPSSHLQYAMAAIKAGKPVYVEKPMTLNAAEAKAITGAAGASGVKLVVAHYRRRWPMFLKLKELLEENRIGTVRLVKLECYKKPLTEMDLLDVKNAWRVNPAIAGGGLFNDLAPHQLDILFWLFGGADAVNGIAVSRAKQYAAADLVTGNIRFTSGIAFSGSWYFSANEELDRCEIIGTHGSISFSFFSQQGITVVNNEKRERLEFEPLQHVQQPMIEAVVHYFLQGGVNPCSGEEATVIMNWMDTFTS